MTRAELLAAGFDAKEVADQLQLYADGVEVPLKLSGDGTLLADSDYLEFYGQGLESPTEAKQTYRQTHRIHQAGIRIASQRAQLHCVIAVY